MKTVYVVEGVRNGWFRSVRHVLGVFDSMEKASKAASEVQDLYVMNEYDEILIQGVPYNQVRNEVSIELSKDYCTVRPYV